MNQELHLREVSYRARGSNEIERFHDDKYSIITESETMESRLEENRYSLQPLELPASLNSLGRLSHTGTNSNWKDFKPYLLEFHLQDIVYRTMMFYGVF